ncbi:peroxidase 3-like [Nymphaea colorata]|nr:peroxidase 3-like [Nymphaea colorata]
MSSIPLLVFVLLGLLSSSQAQLRLGFYDHSCPQAESIVQVFVKEHIPNAPPLAAALLRLHFHDCFVRGCDASLLLNSTKDNQAEKDSQADMGMRGFDFIDAVKSKLEEACPGVVSCADVVALVARDAVVVIGGPYWNVPTGRRDGTVSLASETLNNIPPPTLSFSDLKDSFVKKNLSVKDLVILSGAHTIGITSCDFVTKRLYNFTGKGDQDPSLDKFYAANLKKYKCKTPADKTILEMDPGSFTTFDTHYYTNVVKRRGLFTTDGSLLTDSTARSYIDGILNGSIDFFKEFGLSMEKMGRIEVKTGTEGEIRKVCGVVNSSN